METVNTTKNIFSARQTYPQFLRFILPSIISMVTISFYTTVDGFFVSRWVGPEALASINIVIPFTCLVYGIALMLASGAGAFVSMKMGEKKKEEADSLFSFITASLVILSILITAVSLLALNPMLRALGATDLLMPYAVPYGLLTVLMTVPMMLKLYFEHFARIDGNPNLAFFMSTIGLLLNIVLDYLFIVPMDMGIWGAALGTFLSVLLTALLGVRYFVSAKSTLRFVRPAVDLPMLGKCCFNGTSQLFTELSTGIVTFLFNITIIKFQGELGIAAMSIVIFLYYFFIAIYMGISVGASPVISYSYGARDGEQSKNVLRHSYISLGWMSAAVFAVSLLCGPLLIRIFSEDMRVIEIAESGLRLFSWCFLFSGVNIFMSALFTAVGNGRIAAGISLLRCLVFASAAILLLPLIIGEAGVWLSIPCAEFLTLFFSLFFYKRYHHTLFG